MSDTVDTARERFEIPISIVPSDIDGMGHVNNVVYLRWVQDAAVAHWKTRATPEQQSKWKWVVVRHEIDYKHAAAPGDAIVARTWVGTASDLVFERHTEILRSPDRKLLARARTLWCPVNAATFRISRADDGVRSSFSVPGRLNELRSEGTDAQ